MNKLKNQSAALIRLGTKSNRIDINVNTRLLSSNILNIWM